MRISSIFLVLVLLLIGGGALFLVTWDIPSPGVQVERTLPDDRFPR